MNLKLRFEYHYKDDNNDYLAEFSDMEDIKIFLDDCKERIIIDYLTVVEGN